MYFTSSRGLWWLKNILFLIVLYLVYLLFDQKGESIEAVKNSFSQLSFNKGLLWIVLGLTPINWAFEAWKWQRLASRIEDIGFWEAYKGVLTGLALSTFTPLMIGDYAGKILMLKTQKRAESIGAILLGNGMQLYVSLLFGTISYMYFLWVSQPSPFVAHALVILLLIFCLIVGVVIAFNLYRIDKVPTVHTIIKKMLQYLLVLKEYDLNELKTIFLIATARYLTFTLQFVLLLKVFQIDLSLRVLLAGVGMIFLTKTLASAFNFLGDLSIRELTSVYYFGYFGVKVSVIASATFTIWLINVLFPILVGSFFILALRFSTKKT